MGIYVLGCRVGEAMCKFLMAGNCRGEPSPETFTAHVTKRRAEGQQWVCGGGIGSVCVCVPILS